MPLTVMALADIERLATVPGTIVGAPPDRRMERSISNLNGPKAGGPQAGGPKANKGGKKCPKGEVHVTVRGIASIVIWQL